jgi:two-component system, NarL family, nitrate/nitrite response regulator NarL
MAWRREADRNVGMDELSRGEPGELHAIGLILRSYRLSRSLAIWLTLNLVGTGVDLEDPGVPRTNCSVPYEERARSKSCRSASRQGAYRLRRRIHLDALAVCASFWTARHSAPASSNAARRATCDTGPMPTRVLIVDDNRPFLEAARVLLERQGLSVVGVALTGAEALRRAGELQPDLALVDIMLAEESGFECARDLIEHDRDGGPAVILISTHAEADFADLIAESPARGFLPKSELSADAILRILNGRPR